MVDYWKDFGPFHGRIWLDSASEGPLPRIAAERAAEAITWKVSPHLMTADLFGRIPRRLRHVLGRLIGAPEEQVILGNSATFGIHLLANGLPLRPGDEILLVRGDFPSDILPWLALEKTGVKIRFLEAKGTLPDGDDLKENLTPSTRLFCTSWVHSFSGTAADPLSLGKICASHRVLFVLNASHALGTRPLDVTEAGVDALTCVGYKWLCGPYGTGFCWIRPEVLDTLQYNHAYWQALLPRDYLLKEDEDLTPRGDVGARMYDVFGTANFLNFHPWTASLEYLLGIGIDRIEEHDQHLVDRLLAGLNRSLYEPLSPEAGRGRSALVVISHRDPKRNEEIHRILQREGIDIAFRRGRLRISPHLHNSESDIDRLLEVMNALHF
ncbi:MAG: aminotransferase class V-fold PLP-dependent enzyme [bacterium]|nr:MAG: aminotransferase class V-fold PLP-dependent enzyme [bacterium]